MALKVGELYATFGLDSKEFDSAMESANKSLTNLGEKTKSTFGTIKSILGAQIITKAFTSATSAIKGAINVGMQFEAAMSNVAALSGATAEEMERLTAKAKEMGSTTKYTATESAEALSYMALAGWDANQSIEALDGVLSLAASSGMDLGRAADIVTDFISAFGMEAKDAAYMSDMMAYAQSKSNTTTQMLGDAYQNCASSMHAAGQDIETTTAWLMALANQGIKGSEAGTQMAAVMRDLTQKMENGKTMIGDTAITVMDAAGNFRDLTDIMRDVEAATAGMGTAEASAAIMETFTARSVKAVQTIINEGLDNVQGYEDALRQSAGTAAEQSETMLDNLTGDITIFKSALEGLQITASESFNGVYREIVQAGTEAINALNKGGMKNGIEGIADAAIKLIPSLTDKVVKGLSKLIAGVGKKLPDLLKNLIGTIPSVLDSALDLVPVLTENLLSAAGEAVGALIGNLPQLAWKLISSLPATLGGVAKGIGNLFVGLFDGMTISGIEFADYEGLGELKTELTYDVSTDANVDNSGAEEQIDAAMADFVETLTGYGLSSGEIAVILSFTGTQDELETMLAENFPNLSEAARNAIKKNFVTNTVKNALDELVNGKGEPLLTNEQIASIIGFVTDDDMEGLEKYLTENCPDVYTPVKNAIESALSSGAELTSGVENTSLGFAAQMLYDQLTDGLTDDPKQVNAALASALAVINAKKAALAQAIADGVYIDKDENGVNDLEESVTKLDDLAASLTGFATEYANASTEACKEQGDLIMTEVATVSSAVDLLLGERARLTSYEEQLFNQGVGGAKLSKDDLNAAESYISVTRGQKIADAETLKQNNIEAGMAYEEAQGYYTDAVAKANAEAQRQLEQLFLGQQSETDQVATAMAIMQDQMKSGGLFDPANFNIDADYITKTLGDLGFGSDIINTILEKTLSANGDFDAFNVSEFLAGYDWSTLGDAVQTAIDEGLLSGDYEGLEVNEILAQLFGGEEANKVLSDRMAQEAANAAGAAADAEAEAMANAMETSVMTYAPQTTQAMTDALGSSLWDGSFAAVENGAAEASTEMATAMETAYTDAATTAATNSEAAFEKSGEYMPMGAAFGVEHAQGGLIAAMGAAGTGALAAFNAKVGINSPSTEMAASGGYLMQGAANGVSAGQSLVISAMTRAASAVLSAARASLSSSAGSTIGRDFAKGIANGISAGSSFIKDAAEKAARAAYDASRAALDEHSPSRLAEKDVGLMYDAGIAEGLLGGMREIGNAAARVSGALHDSFTVGDPARGTALTARQAMNANGTDTLSDNADYARAVGTAIADRLAETGALDSAVYMDGTVVGRKTATPVEDTLKRKERQTVAGRKLQGVKS